VIYVKYVIEQLMANSISRESLLAEGDAALTDEELQSFLERDVNETEKMDNWLYKLKEFRVFFSTPLDLDLLLLETFPKLYIDSIDNNSGPYIPKIGKIKDIEKLSPAMDEYEDRVKKNVSDVLGEGGGDGNTYSEEQKKLMVWYKYLFLDRSKPTNHLIAISQISSEITVDSLPEPLKTIMLISTGSNVRGGDLNHDGIDKT
jgi:putative ATP-dependent endonuclease of OLD family